MTKPLSWFISLLLLFTVYSGMAQEVHLIPQIGVNLGTYNFDKTLNNTSQQRLAPGITAGVGFNIAFSPSRDFILQPEINYSMRNSITDFTSTTTASTSIRQKTQLHYVEIPLLARFDFGVGTRYYINVGPSISYAFAGREFYESSTISNFDNINRNADFSHTFNRIDWGIWLGGGVEIPFSESFILLDGRYGIGMRDLYKNMTIPGAGSGETEIGSDGRSRLFHVTVGYALPL